MTLSMHNLKPARGAKSQPKRVGRGNASGKGTTAGRGGKGQKARTGGRNRLKLLGMRRLMLSTPKLRGFKSHHAKKGVVTLDAINAVFMDGAKVTPAALVKKGLVPSAKSGVKILGGALKKKIVVIGCLVSEAAKEAITAAGGEVRA